MAFQSSIMSIWMLLLITYCNSLPFELLNDSSTLEYEFTTTVVGQTDASIGSLDNRTTSVEPVTDNFALEHESTTAVESLHDSSRQDYESTPGITVAIHEDEVNKQLTSDEESSSVPSLNNDGSSEKSNPDELTTPDQGEYPEDETVSSTTDEYLLSSSSPVKFTSEILSSNDGINEKIVEENQSTTVESNTEPDQNLVPTDKTDTELSVIEVESTVSEEMPSVDASEKATESVVSDQSEENTIPSEYDKSAQSSEESEIEQSTTTILDKIQSVVEEDSSDD